MEFVLETLLELRLPDHGQHTIDSTTGRGHSQAAGVKGGLIKSYWSITRQLYDEHSHPRRRSGTTSRLHPDGVVSLQSTTQSRPAGAAGQEGETTPC